MRREQVLKICLNHFVTPQLVASFKDQAGVFKYKLFCQGWQLAKDWIFVQKKIPSWFNALMI